MRVPDPHAPLWKRVANWGRSLSGKLVILLILSMTTVFGLLGYLNVRLHRRHLEQTTLVAAERVSDVIKRNATYYMLRNEREGLYHLINEIGAEPGILHIRIINREGRISFSSDARETNTLVDKRAEACYACHSQTQPLTHLDRNDRFRTYRLADGTRALGIINPIENSPACSSAACHAHEPGEKILGVLDTNLSLAATDASLAQSTRQMVLYTLAAVLIISALSAVFVWRVVYGPLQGLEAGTKHLSSGELGYQIDVPGDSQDELAGLARSFNSMSSQLREAREEINGWTRTLQARVEEKTGELNRAHEEMLRVERMASIGKLAAVVAHEINNPLAGILVYAKLLKKRFSKQKDGEGEVLSSLDLIESESRRCGEIVKNLMTFARAGSMSYEPADLNGVIGRCVRLVQHKLELANIELQLELAPGLPSVHCDAGQIEQVILALVMNAIDAMPNGGNLTLRTRRKNDSEIQIEVRDDGVGIPPEILSNLFEPFFTTKERGRGLGLGLATSRTIVERHLGRIDVASAPGQGSTFTITLPVAARPVAVASPVAAA